MSHLIHYQTFGDSGPVLLLVHGYMAHSAMFDPLVQVMAHDFRLVVVDNRGFGKSADLPGPYTIAQMADDLNHVLDHLGLQRAHVVGYSKGGLVAQTFALENPERVQSLSLVVTFAHKVMSPLERMQRSFLPSVIKRVGAKGLARMLPEGVAGGINISPRDYLSFRKQLLSCRDDVLLLVGNEIFKFDSRPRLQHISVPTLVVSGAEDVVVPIHHQRFLAGNIPGAKIKVLSNAGHGLIYTHTTELAQSLRDFVLQHDAKANAA